MIRSKNIGTNLTPNHSIAQKEVSKHHMTLRRRKRQIPLVMTDNKIDPNTDSHSNTQNSIRDCRVVLDDVCFKNFTDVTGITKSSKINLLCDKFQCKVLLSDIKHHSFKNGSKQISELQYLQQTCGDGNSLRFTRCNSAKCKFQFKFSPSDFVVSSSTLRKHACIRPSNNEYVNCHSSNVVY